MAVGKAHVGGNGGNGHVGVGELSLGNLHFLHQDVVLDAFPGHGGKEGGEVLFIVPQMGGHLADPDVFVDMPVEVIQDFPLKIVLFHYGLGGGAFPQALVLQQAEHHHGVRCGNVGVVIKAVVFEQQPHLVPDYSGVV